MAEDDDENWLPEQFHLHLTVLELGALAAVVSTYKASRPDLVEAFPVRIKGRDGTTFMVDRLLEKIEEARQGPNPP